VRSQTSAEAKPHPPPAVAKVTPPPPATTPTPALDEEVIARKTGTIINELAENKDFKEAMECVKEMKCRPQLHVFVREALNQMMEKTDNHRLMASQLLRDLLRDGELSKDKFREGLEEVLEYAEDIEIDIPRFWDYMSQLLSHPVSDPSLIPLSLVTSLIPAPLVQKGTVGVLATKVMKQLTAGGCTESAVVSLWQGLRWEELGVEGDDLKHLLAREDLGFLLEKVSSGHTSSPHLTQLIAKLQASDTTTDDIIAWIDENCGAECRTANFIRMLSTALLRAFVSGHGNSAKFSVEDFQRRSVVLKKYADSQKELHMQILYTFQSGAHQLDHPPQLLHRIFYALYNNLEMIDEATFVEWRERGTEQIGKGNAVHSLDDFFKWLENANPESDSEP
jgi:translation initiation factor 4G